MRGPRLMLVTAPVALAALLAGSCNSGTGAPAACEFLPGDLVITEIMADPDGADAGNEWFELYNATAGALDLSGLTIEFVASRGAKVHMIRAAGAPTIPAKGYLALGDGVVGTNNLGYSYGTTLGAFGNDSGTIIVRCGSAEVDRVAYGAGAAGPGAPSSGKSLQLTGTQVPEYHANDVPESWCDGTELMADGVNLGTPGAQNTPCATSGCDDGMGGYRPLRVPSVGELVITEIMSNSPGNEDHAKEWIEIYNPTALPLDLLGLQVVYGSTCQSASPITGDGCITVPAAGYVVVAGSADVAANGGVTAVGTFGGSGLINDDGCVGLWVKATEVVVDQVTYGKSTDGHAFSLDPNQTDATLNDDQAAWCVASLGYGSAGGFGSPGLANPACGVTYCSDGGTQRPAVAPAVGAVFVTEVFSNPTGADTPAKEWFEVRVTQDCDLNGLKVTNGNGANTKTWTLASGDCLRAIAGTYVVIAGSTDSAQNGGLPQNDIFAIASLSLYNSPATGGALTLTLEAGGQVIDSATFPAPAEGKSVSLDPTKLDATANDTAANFCPAKATTVFAGTGTPGQANDTCP